MSAEKAAGGTSSLPLAARMARSIRAGGPISIAQFMAQANAAYYGSRDPLGKDGDFITAPEISQMFGELLGLCLADLWLRHGQGQPPAYVELGPGRGTLARDALRAMAQARLTPDVHLVETSPSLRAKQAALIPQACFHDDIDSLHEDRPLFVIANEFFDALPIRQLEKTAQGWRERMVVPRAKAEGAVEESAFVPVAGDLPMDAAVPALFAAAPLGAILESSPASVSIARALSERIARQGGCALIIDYGYEGPALGDTLQALRAHRMTDPFADVGDSDLTAHVDFSALADAARAAGLRISGPVGQGAMLRALGIDARTAQLSRAQPQRADEIKTARNRLVEDSQMGTLFRAMAISHPVWPNPEGFA